MTNYRISDYLPTADDTLQLRRGEERKRGQFDLVLCTGSDDLDTQIKSARLEAEWLTLLCETV